MNKLIALFMLVAVGVSAQGYKNRQPTADERQKIAGVNWYLKDGPQFQIFQKFVGEGENFTLQPTNSILLFRSAGALSNCVAIFPNPTNNPGRAYEVVAVGNVTVVLTNNPVGSFTSVTNLSATTYTVPTNSSARVVSTGTNWLVVPGTK